eukprot:scaffold713_cov131-Cylindrotheca_fusiformis.AAC.31
MNSKVVSFLSLLLLVQSSYGEDIELNWFVPSGGDGFPERTVEPGDTVTFTYGANHNVYIHPTENCSETGAILVGAQGAGSASYTFNVSEVNTTVFFACDFAQHCESGQFVRFTVEAAASIEPSIAPSNSSIAPSMAPSNATMSPTSMPVLPPSVIELAQESGNYTTLLTAIEDEGLLPALEAVSPFTIFGPTDAAFEDAVSDLLGLSLEGLVKGHVVAGAYTSADVVAAGCVELTTLNGTMLGVLYDGASVYVNGIEVVEPDLIADDGVLHGIDGVLLDGSFIPCPSPEPSTSSIPSDLPSLVPSDMPSLPAPSTPTTPDSPTEAPTPFPPTTTSDRSQDRSSPRKMMAVATAVGLAVSISAIPNSGPKDMVEWCSFIVLQPLCLLPSYYCLLRKCHVALSSGMFLCILKQIYCLMSGSATELTQPIEIEAESEDEPP